MKIQFNEKKLEVKEGTRIKDLLEPEINESNILVVAAKFDNKLVSLNYKIKREGKIELVDISSKPGMRVYTRTLLYIMGKAFHEVYPKALLTVNYQLHNSIYCDVDNMEITEEIINNVRAKMQEIVDKDLKIRNVSMDKAEAQEFYEKEKTIKGKLQLDSKLQKNVYMNFCEDYYNYFYGVIAPSTGYVKVFDIMKYSDGFLVRYPSRKITNRLVSYVETKKLLKALKEYEDIHRVINVNTVYKLNMAIKENRIKEVIMLDEALHEKRIAELADKIAQKEKVKMILIAGPSSSGKTTFAQRLGLQLKINGIKPVTISVDNYFVEREDTPRDENGDYDFENIEAIDLKLFNEHLIRLLKGEEVEMPEFDFKTGHKQYKGKKLKLQNDEVLVIEGIHCLNDRLTSSIPKDEKYKIYISDLTVINIDYFNRISTTDTRLVRRMVRDYQFRGYSAWHTLHNWESVGKGEEKNIFPFQEEADSIFNTSLIYELAVLREFAMPLLKEIDRSMPEYDEARRIYNLLKYFEPISSNLVPTNSLLKEFIGGGDFEY